MADTITPYVTSTLSAATIEAQAAGLSAVNGALAKASATSSGAIASATASLTSALPTMPSLSGINASVAGLTSRLGNPAALLSSIPSPANAAASALASLGLGGSGSISATAGASIANLAKTTFSTGSNDKLATVDVYTADSASSPVDIAAPIQAINPLTMLATMSSYLGTANALIGDYKKLASLPLSASALLNGVLSSSPLIQSAFNSLPIAIKNAIVVAQAFTSSGSASNIIPKNSISITNNGVTSNVINSTLHDVNGMVAMTAALSNGTYTPTVTDQTAIPIILSNVIAIASSMRLPGAYGAIIGSMAPTPANTRIKGTLASLAANTAVSNGNLGLLSEVAKSGIPLPNKRHVVNNFSKNYAFAPDESSKDFALIGAQLRSAFTAINPTWNKATTQAGGVNDLTALLGASADLQKVIAVTASIAHIPIVVKPTTVITVPVMQVSTYSVPTPSGAIATTIVNSDGSVTHTLTYPAQGCPAPMLDDTAVGFMGPPVPGSYSLPNGRISSTEVNELASAAGKVVIDRELMDGTTQTFSTLSNGTQVITSTDSNGVVITTTLNASVSDSDVSSALSVAGDPLVGTAYLSVSDPMLAASATQQFCDMDIQDSAETNSPALSTMNAADAINYSFPYSNMNDLTVMEA